MKRCNMCGEEKALDRFHRRKDSRDGLQGHCKGCIKAYHDGIAVGLMRAAG